MGTENASGPVRTAVLTPVPDDAPVPGVVLDPYAGAWERFFRYDYRTGCHFYALFSGQTSFLSV